MTKQTVRLSEGAEWVVDDEAEFRIACAWVVGKMQDLGAPLDYVS